MFNSSESSAEGYPNALYHVYQPTTLLFLSLIPQTEVTKTKNALRKIESHRTLLTECSHQ